MKYVLVFVAGAVLAGGLVFVGLRARPSNPQPQQPKQAEFDRTDTLSAPAISLPVEVSEPISTAGPVRRRKPAVRPFRGVPSPVVRTVAMEVPPPPVVEAGGEDAVDGIPALVQPAADVPAPPEPNRVTLTPGTILTILLDEDLSSKKNVAGDVFSATLDQPVIIDGFIIAERGSHVEGRVAAVKRSGRTKGTASLVLELVQLQTSDGQQVDIATDPFTKRAVSGRGRDAAKVGAAASIGAAIGAIAGGGHGAVIGAAIGGATGAGAILATRGAPATLRAETRLPFRVSRPITITERIY